MVTVFNENLILYLPLIFYRSIMFLFETVFICEQIAAQASKSLENFKTILYNFKNWLCSVVWNVIVCTICLLLQPKPWGMRGASHQPAFVSNRLSVTRVIVVSTQRMKKMRTWGWSSLVWIKLVAWDKNQGVIGECYVYCISCSYRGNEGNEELG